MAENEIDRHFKPCGPCAFCGGPDARHRLLDAIADRHRAGEPVEELAKDYGLSVEAVRVAVQSRTHWKDVACPTCRAKPGESCGRQKFGVPWVWERTAPHAARKRLAAAAVRALSEGVDETK